MEFFYNLRAVANLQNDTFWTQNRHFLINLTLLKQKGTFLGRKKPPEAAAGHDTLVLRTKTLLAGMAHGRADRTSRRAEIPPPEEAALRAAPQRGAAAPLCGLLWWRNLSPPACPVRTPMRHAG